MSLVYDRCGIKIYHGDWRDCPAVAGVDYTWIATDPPYGIAHPCSYKSRGRTKLAQCIDWPDVIGDNKPFDPSELLAKRLPTLLWGANHFSDKLPASTGWIVWNKKRPHTMDQATCELAWTNYVKGVRHFEHLWNGCMKASERKENYHPTQKPVALYEWILDLKWCPTGACFDPYAGAGPMAVACAKRGRGCVACEIESRYIDSCISRVDAAINQWKDKK